LFFSRSLHDRTFLNFTWKNKSLFMKSEPAGFKFQ
jgi:hypothetical protein